MVTLLSFIHTLLLFVIAFPLQFFAKAAAYGQRPKGFECSLSYYDCFL